ncbi:MAG: hypothetical protein KFB97_13205 [Cyanobium sp. M30B3]|nr:MAG: hypothetical protein KFB97_13205 [Cyanobium sp. M30B3]
MLASTLGTIVLLLFGSAALVAGSLTWQTASSRGGDAEQAREAAEWGFNTLVDRLNEPGNNYLLVSKWADSNWKPTADLRTTCGITTDSRGVVQPDVLVSDTKTVGSREVRYRLTNFVPPQYPNPNEPPEALLEPCKDSFGNLAGGTARLTIVGEVIHNGTVVARQEIARSTTVDAIGGDGSSASIPPTPMPVLALGTGDSGAISLGDTDQGKRPEFLFDSNGNWKGDPGQQDTKLTIYCLQQDPAPCYDELTDISQEPGPPNRYQIQNLSTDDFLAALPASPPFASNPGNGNILRIGNGNLGNNNNLRDFPYQRNSSNLQAQCSNLTLQGEDVIACNVRFDLPDNRVFSVRTDLTGGKPVVLYLRGDDDHKIGKRSRIINKLFANSRNSDPGSWSALRIFGDSRPGSTYRYPVKPKSDFSSDEELDDYLKGCTSGDQQKFEVGEDSVIEGAMIWVPKGEFDLKDHGNSSRLGLFGALWVCKVTYGKNFVVLNNSSATEVSSGIAAALGLQGTSQAPLRFVARGVERTI